MRSAISPVGESIAALLRGEAPPLPATGLTPSPDELLRLPGAEMLALEGTHVFGIRREMPAADRDLARSLSRAVERIGGKDPEGLDPGLRPLRGRAVEDLVVLDLETTGFWGCSVFLVGLLLWEERRLVTRQLLARDYSEEPAVLRAAAGWLSEPKALVTFNGKSFDVPFLRDRAGLFRIQERVGGLPHIDVLHPARRRWASRFPDCRLQTLERRVLGIHRTDDVPGGEIPALYHRFAATGDPELIEPVLRHGRIDLSSTLRLLCELLN